MGLLGIQTSHVPDMASLVKGEYLLECIESEDGVAQSGRPMVKQQYRAVEHPASFPIYHNVNLPIESDKQSTQDLFIGKIKALKIAHGFDADADFESDALVGNQVFAVLKEEEGNNGPRNIISYFSAGQAPVGGDAAQDELDPAVTGQGEDG